MRRAHKRQGEFEVIAGRRASGANCQRWARSPRIERGSQVGWPFACARSERYGPRVPGPSSADDRKERHAPLTSASLPFGMDVEHAADSRRRAQTDDAHLAASMMRAGARGELQEIEALFDRAMHRQALRGA